MYVYMYIKAYIHTYVYIFINICKVVNKTKKKHLKEMASRLLNTLEKCVTQIIFIMIRIFMHYVDMICIRQRYKQNIKKYLNSLTIYY